MPHTPEPVFDWPDDRPELLPFLPVVYAAWSDGVLTATELRAIRDRAASQEWLDGGAREALTAWLDPSSPPPASALTGLRDRLRVLRDEFLTEAPGTLVELGLALARAEAGEGIWTQPEAEQGLRELEHELGIAPGEG